MTKLRTLLLFALSIILIHPQTGFAQNLIGISAPENSRKQDPKKETGNPPALTGDGSQKTNEPLFRMVLQTGYADMPTDEQLNHMGFHRIKLLTSWFFFPPGQGHPDEITDEVRTRIINNTQTYLSDHQEVILDIEHWHYGTNTSYEERAASIEKLSEVIDIMRSVRPTLRLSYYSMPIRDYWNVYENCAWSPSRHELCTKNEAAWHAANDQMLPLYAKLDFLTPSLYTFYDNPAGWTNYAVANMDEAHRMNAQMGTQKDIYTYLWPRYHDSSDMAYQLIDEAYWRLQLEIMFTENADGVVIWDNVPSRPFKKVVKEDPWFMQTVSFMEDHGIPVGQFYNNPSDSVLSAHP